MDLIRKGNRKTHGPKCYASGGRVASDISDPLALPNIDGADSYDYGMDDVGFAGAPAQARMDRPSRKPSPVNVNVIVNSNKPTPPPAPPMMSGPPPPPPPAMPPPMPPQGMQGMPPQGGAPIMRKDGGRVNAVKFGKDSDKPKADKPKSDKPKGKFADGGAVHATPPELKPMMAPPSGGPTKEMPTSAPPIPEGGSPMGGGGLRAPEGGMTFEMPTTLPDGTSVITLPEARAKGGRVDKAKAAK